jgi:glycosyltransferase involved in cell wall biosynthesis
MNPLVTIIIPAYNVENYIGACLQSMLNQTYTNYEILIVNDAATDNTLRIIQQFTDTRIRIIRNETNVGLAASVNKAIQQAEGVYIARMDADDIAHPQRLQKQVNFLQRHPHVSVLGTAMQSMGYYKYVHRFPESHPACKAQLLFNVCFGHPTVLIRKAVFDKFENLYRDELRQYSEEYELWCRLVDKVTFANLPEVLLDYRTFEPSEKSAAEQKRKTNSYLVRKNFIAAQWGEQSENDYVIHDNICNLKKARDVNELTIWINWLRRCIILNNDKKAFAVQPLRYEVSKRAFELAYWNKHLGIKSLVIWYGKQNQLTAFVPSWSQHIKFVLRCLFRL